MNKSSNNYYATLAGDRNPALLGYVRTSGHGQHTETETDDKYDDEDDGEDAAYGVRASPGSRDVRPCWRTPAVPDVNIPHTVSVEIPVSTLAAPPSLFGNLLAPRKRPARELDAVEELLMEAQGEGAEGGDGYFTELLVDDFAMYYEADQYGLEMRGAHELCLTSGARRMYLDGVLRDPETKSGKQFWVERVVLEDLSVGNLELGYHTVGGHIWVRSARLRDKDIWYRLGRPCTAYGRFHEGFTWVADMGKHMVDFLETRGKKGRPVEMQDFVGNFSKFLLKHHKRSKAFQAWYDRQGRQEDFRSAVAAHPEYYYWAVRLGLGAKEVDKHPLWKQVMNQAVKMMPMTMPLEDGTPKTACTQFVYHLFSHLPFGNMLHPVGPAETARQLRKEQLGRFRPRLTRRITKGLLSPRPAGRSDGDDEDKDGLLSAIRIGSVISTPPDAPEVSKWRRETSKGRSDHEWYGVVQNVHRAGDAGKRWFDVIWMYKSADTPCAVMKYPYDKELFLSNHCTCLNSRLHAKISQEQVLGVHSIEWGGSPLTKAEFFVRQLYDSCEQRWRGLREGDLRCHHGRKSPNTWEKFVPGDTVLVMLAAGEGSSELLEPCELIDIDFQAGSEGKAMAKLRRLMRRQKFHPTSAPNELLYSDVVVTTSPRYIHGACLVRFFPEGSKILPPYDGNGAANCFFMTYRHMRDGTGRAVITEPMSQCPPSLRQGFDPAKPPKLFPKLRGLDLFCGGGNFGRGLEDCGAVEYKWCNDIWDVAVHTYMANVREPGRVEPYLGSCDDLLRDAMHAKFSVSAKVPAPGEVDLISGGSPCQGFSRLTIDKSSPKQRKNQSMVASFVSFVDFYRPKYGILENVPSMVQSSHDRENDVFSQMVCAVVGMGYQCQMFRLDAWTFGAPQQRSRIFLIFASPDVRLPARPPASHSHPEFVRTDRLGRLANGHEFESRDLHEPTAFRYVCAADSIGDLPDIQDGKVDCCPRFPDHRLGMGYTAPIQQQIRAIPTQPYGMNFAAAWHVKPRQKRQMNASQRDLFPPEGTSRTKPDSNGWGKIHPHRLIATVPTTCNPTDQRQGTWSHWSQPRPLTILEVKRAQGFRDEDVLLGTRRQKWKLVGNSVSRQVAIAIGLTLREAWLGSNVDGEEKEQLLASEVEKRLKFTAKDDDGEVDKAHHDEQVGKEANKGQLKSLKRPRSNSGFGEEAFVANGDGIITDLPRLT